MITNARIECIFELWDRNIIDKSISLLIFSRFLNRMVRLQHFRWRIKYFSRKIHVCSWIMKKKRNRFSTKLSNFKFVTYLKVFSKRFLKNDRLLDQSPVITVNTFREDFQPNFSPHPLVKWIFDRPFSLAYFVLDDENWYLYLT